MKYLIAILLLLPSLTNAQSWQWARHAGGPRGSEGLYSAVDPFGNVFGCGGCSGSISFGSDTIVHPIGESAPFIVKYDSSGNQLWVKSTTSGSALPLGISTDCFGNLYLLGEYNTTVNLDGHILTNSNSQPHQIFLAKYNALGYVVWAENIGNVIAYKPEGAITTDRFGNIYLTCTYFYSPTLGAYSFVNADASQKSDDLLVTKLDSSGNIQWAKSFGGLKQDNPASIIVAGSNNIYISGDFTSPSIIFGSSVVSNAGSSLNKRAIYLLKLDNFGNPVWSRYAGGVSQYVYARGVSSNSSEDIFMVGAVDSGQLSFGPYQVGSISGNLYGYVVKYNSLGSVLWAKQMQGEVVQAWSVATDPCDNVWISGSLDNSIADTIDGHTILAPAGSWDPMFIAGWSSSGAYISTISLASGGDDNNYLSIDKCGNLCVCGDFLYSIIIGTDTFGTAVGGENNFVAKYNPNLGCSRCYENLVEDPRYKPNMIVYPNPANSLLTITSPTTITALSIYNLVGQTIYSHAYHSEKVEVDVSGLAPGVYFVKINGVEVRRVVVGN